VKIVVSDLQQVGGFLRVLRFTPPAYIQLPYDHDHDGPGRKIENKIKQIRGYNDMI
jgi:hypothetical protein